MRDGVISVVLSQVQLESVIQPERNIEPVVETPIDENFPMTTWQTECWEGKIGMETGQGIEIGQDLLKTYVTESTKVII